MIYGVAYLQPRAVTIVVATRPNELFGGLNLFSLDMAVNSQYRCRNLPSPTANFHSLQDRPDELNRRPSSSHFGHTKRRKQRSGPAEM